MSLASLADEEISRTEGDILSTRFAHNILPRFGISPLKFTLVAGADGGPSERESEQVGSAAKPPGSRASNALDGLARYIPVEATTLYVAALSVMPALKETFPSISEAGVYWLFGVLTPVLFLLVFIGKRRSAGLSLLPASIRNWPWWKVIASAVAFLAWALAVPTTPYLSSTSGKVVAAFLAILISTFLTILEPIFEGP